MSSTTVSGMHVGDSVLGQLGELMRHRLPPGAFAARISGDRFAVLLPTQLDDAENSQNRTRGCRAAGHDPRRSPGLHISVSIGVALLDTAAGERIAIRWPRRRPRAKAPRIRGRIASRSSSWVGRSTAKRSPEMRAANAPGGSLWRISSPSCPSTESPTCMPKLSLMTCSWSASMYSAVPVFRALRVCDDCPHALLECGARIQTAQGVIAALDDADCLARENLGQPASRSPNG